MKDIEIIEICRLNRRESGTETKYVGDNVRYIQGQNSPKGNIYLIKGI